MRLRRKGSLAGLLVSISNAWKYWWLQMTRLFLVCLRIR
jgi:hypothetical protein